MDTTEDFLQYLPQSVARDLAGKLRYVRGNSLEVQYRQDTGRLLVYDRTTHRMFTWAGEDLHDLLRHMEDKRLNTVFGKAAIAEPMQAPEYSNYYFDEAATFSEEAWAQIPNELKRTIQQISPPPTPIEAKPKQESPVQPVLIIAGSREEAQEFAVAIMGWGTNQWVYIDSYMKIHQYRNSSVYLVGTARERSDFPAIEGLFLMNKHEVLDTNE